MAKVTIPEFDLQGVQPGNLGAFLAEHGIPLKTPVRIKNLADSPLPEQVTVGMDRFGSTMRMSPKLARRLGFLPRRWFEIFRRSK